MRALLIIVAVSAACGDDARPAADAGPPDARGVPDLTTVTEHFTPATATVAEALGTAYYIPHGTDAADTNLRDGVIANMSSIGLRTCRRDILWQRVQPTKGPFDFTAYDLVIDQGLAAGVDTVPILDYGNPAFNADGKPDAFRPPDDLADFAAYVTATVGHYKGRLKGYEVWNEPNLGFRFWRPREDAAAYANLLHATYAAAKAADPAATIALGGLIYQPSLSPGAERFLEDLYRDHPDLAGDFDVLAFHPYELYPPHAGPETRDDASGEMPVALMVARMRAVMQFYGDTKPIWATEVGWPTFDYVNGSADYHVNAEQQARWTVRAILLLMGAGVDRVFLYTMIDFADPLAYPPEGAFGMFQYDDPADGYTPTPKPSWQAVTTLLQLAGGLTLDADVSADVPGLPKDARAYRLTSATRTVTVVWRTDDLAMPTVVTVPVDAAKTLTVFDEYGHAQAASAAIALTGAPTYVVEE